MSAKTNTALFDLIKSDETLELIALNAAINTSEDKPGVYHMQSPQDPDKDKLPCITYYRMDSDPKKHLKGDSGLVFAEYQFNIYGKNAFDHSHIADLFYDAMNAWLNKTVSGVNFRSIFVLSDDESYLSAQNGSQKGEYQTSVRLSAKYARTKAIQP